MSYHELIRYMKDLRAFFAKEYDAYFKLGKVYQGNPDYSYFSLTTAELKKEKLKFVIILNHNLLDFSICLSAQNKNIRKRYWDMFRNIDWNKYHLVEDISNSLSIMDHTIVREPNFSDRISLTKKIESESIKFINELKEILD